MATTRPTRAGAPLFDFEERSNALAIAARGQEGVAGLVLLGSAASASRRDEWSDHDFFILADPESKELVRQVKGWLPHPAHLVAVAREGAIGFAALYDDGHVFEFAAATAGELEGALVTDYEIVFDHGPVAPLVAASVERAAAVPDLDPANEMCLVLFKLLIGVGRARRGEVLNGGQMVRNWAVNHFVRAVRGRIPVETSHACPIDPVRRFERDYPELGAALARLLEMPVEDAAAELFSLARSALEPEWDDFPSDAADVVAKRLGWARRSR